MKFAWVTYDELIERFPDKEIDVSPRADIRLSLMLRDSVLNSMSATVIDGMRRDTRQDRAVKVRVAGRPNATHDAPLVETESRQVRRRKLREMGKRT